MPHWLLSTSYSQASILGFLALTRKAGGAVHWGPSLGGGVSAHQQQLLSASWEGSHTPDVPGGQRPADLPPSGRAPGQAQPDTVLSAYSEQKRDG